MEGDKTLIGNVKIKTDYTGKALKFSRLKRLKGGKVGKWNNSEQIQEETWNCQGQNCKKLITTLQN